MRYVTYIALLATLAGALSLAYTLDNSALAEYEAEEKAEIPNISYSECIDTYVEIEGSSLMAISEAKTFCSRKGKTW